MNGPHDIGGMQNLGPVPYEKSEPVFHEAWEGRVYALNRALGAWRKWNGYTARYQTDQWSSADYFGMSYYERWFTRNVQLLVKTGMISREEAESGKPAPGSAKATPPMTADMVVPMFTQGRFAGRNRAGASARFRVGQRVRTRNMNPTGHTRMPRYARGRFGVIARDYGVFSLPDAIAHELPDRPQHVYSVRFEARELWGEQARPQDRVYLDLWDGYLESA
jgi:nitrile hydratase